MTNPLNEAGITATFAAIFDRLNRLEAIAAAQDTPSSPANAPEVPQGQAGGSDGTERNRVTKWNSHPDAPRWREHSILLNSISWRISEALGQVGPWSRPRPCRALGDTEHQVDLESNITEVLAAIRVWRKVQACVSGTEISTIDDSDVLVSTDVWHSTPSGFLAWLKDGEA